MKPSQHLSAPSASHRSLNDETSKLPQPCQWGSQVQVKPSPNESDEGQSCTEEWPNPFVREQSVQEEIVEKSAYEELLPSSLSSLNHSRPRTFAEAAMSTHGSRGTTDQTSDAEVLGQASLESLSTFKYIIKKKIMKIEAWPTLGFSTEEEDPSDVEDNSVSQAGLSRAASPKKQTFTPVQLPLLFPKDKWETTPVREHKSKGRFAEFNTESEIDTDLTPTQPRFDPSLPPPAFGAVSNTCLDLIESDVEDSQSVKDRFEAAMARLGGSVVTPKATGLGNSDAFDTLEWDPDLSAAAVDTSPEPITAKPQPLSYTTVGSLVNPDAVPQFTAPNRIQREGAGRRPPMHSVQRRGPPPPLNMQNSMQYTQQLSQGSPSYNNTPPPSVRSARASRSSQPSGISNQETNILARLHGLAAPQMYSGNQSANPNQNVPTTFDNMASVAGDSTGKVFSSSSEANRAEEIDRLNKVHAPLQGLDKMQTLQRLAKYENPQQEQARNRLSQFSIAKPPKKTVTNPTGATLSEIHDKDQNDTIPKALTYFKIDSGVSDGELDRGYKFPPPGLAHPSMPQKNPLLGVNGTNISETARYGPAATSTHPPGYPQPLTAGPPGQRSVGLPFNKMITASFDGNWPESRRSTYNHQVAHRSTSSWSNNYDHCVGQSAIMQNTTANNIEYSKILDTLHFSAVQKYYPYGFPIDMSGKHNPLPLELEKEMEAVSEERTEEQKKAQKQKERDDWFYSGQRAYFKTAEEHVCELEHRQAANPFGPIGPPSKKPLPPVQRKPLTIDEMNKMKTCDAAAPVLDAAFGSLLGYADKSSSSRSSLSKFTRSPAWQIDSSENGNKSFFGEDWGPPPKRYGRDPRYQPAFHDPSKTHWEY